MTAPVLALLIATDGTTKLGLMTPDLATIYRLTEATGIEVISGEGTWHAYLNDVGKLDGTPPNPSATSIAARLGNPHTAMLGDTLCGPVLFLGPGHPDPADEGDVPDDVLAAAHGLGVTVNRVAAL